MSRDQRAGERGMASTVLIIAIPALVAVALLFVTMLSDGLSRRTRTSTAADAASLAAAEQWRSYVDDVLNGADGLAPDRTLDRLQPLLTADAATLDASRIQRRARDLAGANDATLLSLSTRLTGRGVEFSVRTRSLRPANDTAIRLESSATAVVEVSGGVCFRGSRLGLLLGGSCTGWDDIEEYLNPPPPPAPPEEEDEDDAAEPTPTPTPTPRLSFSRFRTDVRLVA